MGMLSGTWLAGDWGFSYHLIFPTPITFNTNVLGASLNKTYILPLTVVSFCSFILMISMCSSLFSRTSLALSLLYGSTAEHTSVESVVCLLSSSLAFFKLSVVWIKSAKSFSARGSDSIPRGWRYPSWSRRRRRFVNFCRALSEAVAAMLSLKGFWNYYFNI